MKRTLAVLLLVALVTGCSGLNRSGTMYHTGETLQQQRVVFGTVLAVTDVRIAQQQSSYVGGALGAIAGGAALSGVGGGSGNTAAIVAGAIAGVAAGHLAERAATTRAGQEIVVKLDDGRTVSVVQPASQRFNVGDNIRVVGTSQDMRVVK